MTGGDGDPSAEFVERLTPRLGPIDVRAAVGDGIINAAAYVSVCADHGAASGAEILFTT